MADYITDTEFRAFIKDDTTIDGDAIATAITTGSREVDKICKRYFSQDSAVSAKYFGACDSWHVDLDSKGQRWDISTTTGLIVKTDQDGDGVYETTLTNGTHFFLEPINGTRNGITGWPYDSIRMLSNGGQSFPTSSQGYRPAVEITAKWGWAAVPAQVKMATKLIANALYGRSDSRYGVLNFDVGLARVRSDPTVLALLEPFMPYSRIVA